jgi:hypothetical protein
MGVFFYLQIYSTILFWYTILNLIMYRGLIARISFSKFFMSKHIDKFFPKKKKKKKIVKFVWKHINFPNFSQFFAQISLRKINTPSIAYNFYANCVHLLLTLGIFAIEWKYCLTCWTSCEIWTLFSNEHLFTLWGFLTKNPPYEKTRWDKVLGENFPLIHITHYPRLLVHILYTKIRFILLHVKKAISV